MRNLWFKAQYVAPILDGTKTDTIRAHRPRCQPGDLVRASIGPRTPFAVLRVLTVEPLTLADLPADRVAEVAALYPRAARLWRVQFVLHHATAPR